MKPDLLQSFLKDSPSNSTLVIDYTYENQIYSLCLNIVKNKPKKVLNAYKAIQDSNKEYIKGEDITIAIKKILGPNEDCHQNEICPLDLGLEGLFLTFINSNTFDVEEILFKSNDNISIPE